MNKKIINNWKKTLIAEDSRINNAIKNLNDTKLQICIVVSKNQKLVGTITDGDVRRGILKGFVLKDKVKKIMKKNPFVVTKKLDRKAIKYLMKANSLLQVPMVDKQRKVIGLHLWNDGLNAKVRDNFVILMAGGFGKRMRPKTNKVPKPMLEVNGRPILEQIIENVRDCGFKNIIITTHYLSEKITGYFKDGKQWGVNISYIHEKKPLGTAGSLGLIKKKINKPIIIANGDVISDINFSEVLDYHNYHKADATMAVRIFERSNPFGVIDHDGILIKKITEKPVYKTTINSGIYVIEPKQVKAIKANQHYKMTDLFLEIKESGKKIIVFPMHEAWRDIGSVEDIEITKLK